MTKPGSKITEKQNSEKERNTSQNSNKIFYLLILIVGLLLGLAVQNYINDRDALNEVLSQNFKKIIDASEESRIKTEKVFQDLRENIKNDILEVIESRNKKEAEKSIVTEAVSVKSIELVEKSAPEQNENKSDKIQDEIVDDNKTPSKKTVIDDKIQDDQSALKFKPGDSIKMMDQNEIKLKVETKESKPEPIKINAEIIDKKEPVKTEPKKEQEKKTDTKQKDVAPENKNFKSKKISEMKPKKMWIPIPNSNGGHRRVPAIEIKPGKEHSSSVKVWLYEEFLSKDECEKLIQAHESHVKNMLKFRPIICFNSLDALKTHLVNLKREKFAEIVSENDFTEGTLCLNKTFSRQLEKWGLKWSYSTSFYSGETRFSNLLSKRIEDATMLNSSHGGGFQIISYPNLVGQKSQVDCLTDLNQERDIYASFMIYLNTLDSENGGETVFPELGIDVKPREGRALTWNSMNYKTGKCEPKSAYNAAINKHEVNKKFVIQRWYHYKNFHNLGKRMPESEIPERDEGTPKVSCDNFDSCTMYDEWNSDHIID